MIIDLDPELYTTYEEHENEKPVLYVELLKALYGTQQAALLIWH